MEEDLVHTTTAESEMLLTSANDCCDELEVDIYLDLLTF